MNLIHLKLFLSKELLIYGLQLILLVLPINNQVILIYHDSKNNLIVVHKHKGVAQEFINDTIIVWCLLNFIWKENYYFSCSLSLTQKIIF